MAHVWLALIAALLFMGAYEESRLGPQKPRWSRKGWVGPCTRARSAARGVLFSGIITGAWLVLFGG
jgi:hypothetical protein